MFLLLRLIIQDCFFDTFTGAWDPPTAIDFNRYFQDPAFSNPALITYQVCPGQNGAGCPPDQAYALAHPLYDIPTFDCDIALVILPANAPRNDIVPIMLNADTAFPSKVAALDFEHFGWGLI